MNHTALDVSNHLNLNLKMFRIIWILLWKCF